MGVEPSDDRHGVTGLYHRVPSLPSGTPDGRLSHTPDSSTGGVLMGLIRRARHVLPGDPDFGDPLSLSGMGSVQTAARTAQRLLGSRDTAGREMSLATLQVWQALTERVSGREANPEVTLVFTDLVGFSVWSLQAGDDATLRVLRRVAQVAEPPLLAAGGHIVKRMGDGMMAVFTDPTTAIRATIAAREAVRAIELDGYTPRMRAGIHTGRPQHIGSDWLGIDVTIAARAMERATHGGLIVSQRTLEKVSPDDLESMKVSVRALRRQVIRPRQSGVPADLVMYRLKSAPHDAAEQLTGSSDQQPD